MAIATPCQTPGAKYHATVTDTRFTFTMDWGRPVSMTEEQAELFIANLHNLVEILAAPLYQEGDK